MLTPFIPPPPPRPIPVPSEQRDPPLVVTDLYEDIKDGVMLLALLEVLSGHKLVGLIGGKET